MAIVEQHSGELGRLLRGTGLSMGLRIIGAGLGFLFNLLLARMAGAEGAGLIFLALSLVGLAAIVARVGLDVVAVREVAALLAENRWREIRATGQAAIRIALTIGTALSIAIWLTAPSLATHVFSKPGLLLPLQGLALSVVPMSLSVVYSELLRGAQRFAESQLVQIVIAAVVALPIMAVFGSNSAMVVAVVSLVAGQVAALLLAAFWWHRLMKEKASTSNTELAWRGLLNSAWPLFWFTLLNTLTGTLDVLLLGTLGSASDVGVYGIAVRLAMLTSFILLAANSYTAPHFAAYYRRREITAMVQLAVHASRLTLLCASPLLLLFLLVPSWILGIFGHDFAAGAPALVILACAQFVNVATASVGQLLIMTGHSKEVRNFAFVSVALTAGMLVLLVPRLGATGAAIATASGVICQKVLATWMVRRCLRIRVDAFHVIHR